MYTIYKLVCTISNKSYIGLTKNLPQRLGQHKASTSDCTYIKNAIQKYGWDTFTVEILIEGLSLQEANAYEQQLIESHNTLTPKGYNLQSGGEHRILGEESRKKISQTLTGRTRPDVVKQKCADSHRGKPLSHEHKNKIKATRLRGVPRSAETKAKISATQKGRPGRPGCEDNLKKYWQEHEHPKRTPEQIDAVRKALLGKPRSEETKAKIRATAIARNLAKREFILQQQAL